MTEVELLAKLAELQSLPHETEWVEFKEANNGYDFRKLGKYFSAISNEANLQEQSCGWLIFGVRDSDHAVCGSKFRENAAELDSLKREVADQTNNRMSFLEIYPVNHPDGRVVMLQIPPAMQGMPTSFKGHHYGRDSESLGALSIRKIERIRNQRAFEDWSTVVCENATIADLDPAAIQMARDNFAAKNRDKSFANEIENWDEPTFLDRAKLTLGGQITRATVLLLGRAESAHLVQPAIAQLTWKLTGEEEAYEHFGPPFLLSTNSLYSKIRNTNQKLELPGRLVPLEVPKYDKWVVLEALHNAIAHQDYSMQSRIVITESVDRLVFENAGSFFEGSLEDYTLSEKTPKRYRNRFLADAMVNVNMIDTMGYGIRKMFIEQRKRFYPLPDVDTSIADSVSVTIHGKVIDVNYTAALAENEALSFHDVILLDRVQKRATIEKAEADALRRKKLVEGRYPKLFVAAKVASGPAEKAQYIKNKAFDDKHYKDMIEEYIKKYGSAEKKEIEKLVIDKLSDVLDEAQKKKKVDNLLQAMSKRENRIKSMKVDGTWKWVLEQGEN